MELTTHSFSMYNDVERNNVHIIYYCTLKNVIGSDHVVLHGFAASLHPLPQCLFSCIQGAGLAEAGSLSDEYVDH